MTGQPLAIPLHSSSHCRFIGQVKNPEIFLTIIYLAGRAIAKNWPLKTFQSIFLHLDLQKENFQ